MYKLVSKIIVSLVIASFALFTSLFFFSTIDELANRAIVIGTIEFVIRNFFVN